MSREDSWTEAVNHYRAGVRDSMLAEYRCKAKGCLLLRVWNSPNGEEFFAPAARVSDRFVSAGQLHWLGFNRSDSNKTGDRAGRLSDVAALDLGGWLWLLCAHVKEPLWLSDFRRDCAHAEPGKPARAFVPRVTRPAR